MALVPLVEATRGGHAESIHYGAIAVVNARGDLLYRAGDPHFPTFTRSTIKPFQALPFLRGGGHERFGFDARELALLCASHSGEAMHTATVEGMLRKAGCEEHHLRCGCHVPIYYPTHDKTPDPGTRFNQLHNNCSGKHAGFLAWCIQHGAPLDSYLEPAHPLQQAVRNSLAEVAGVAPETMPMGIDGCSAPNFAWPLSSLALAYARLAQADRDPDYGTLMGNLFSAMTAYPELVSGSGRSDLAFMQTAPGDWVAKIGAEAVQAIGIRSMGLGIAVKIADGNARALFPAAIAALKQIGAIGAVDNTPLASWANPRLSNCKGMPTGDLRAVFTLAKH